MEDGKGKPDYLCTQGPEGPEKATLPFEKVGIGSVARFATECAEAANVICC